MKQTRFCVNCKHVMQGKDAMYCCHPKVYNKESIEYTAIMSWCKRYAKDTKDSREKLIKKLGLIKKRRRLTGANKSDLSYDYFV